MMYAIPVTYEDPPGEAPIGRPHRPRRLHPHIPRTTEGRGRGNPRKPLPGRRDCASLTTRQALSSLLRSCVTQRCGYLVRVIPPHLAVDFAHDIDRVVLGTFAGISELDPLTKAQPDLVSIPAAERGWGGPSLVHAHGIARIIGIASTPQVIPGTLTALATDYLRRNIDQEQSTRNSIQARLDLDTHAKSNLTSVEFAYAGYVRPQKVVGRVIHERVNDFFLAQPTSFQQGWADGGAFAARESAPACRAAHDWVTTLPKDPDLALVDDEFLLALRSRMLVPRVA